MKLLYKAWIIWLIAAIFYALEFFQRVAPGVIAKPLMATFHIDPVTLGTIISLYFYAYAISQIPVGLILDRFGARISLSLAALIVAVGTYLFAHSDQLLLLAVARILVGIGSAFAFVGCLKLARDWFSNRQFAFIVGLTNTLGVIGALFGEEPLTKMIQHLGWQQSLMITAYIGVLVAVLIFVVVRNNKSDKAHLLDLETGEKMSVARSLKTVLSSRQAWLVAIYAGLMVAPVISFAELWAVSFIETNYHLSATLAAQANTLIFIGIAIGGPINGWLSSHFKRRKAIMLIGNVVALILFLMVIFVAHIPLSGLEVILFLFGFFTSSMLVTFPLNTENHDKRLSATIIAFTNMMIMIIGALFQPLIGKLLEVFMGSTNITQTTSHDFRMALLILPIALFINLIILYFIRESRCRNRCLAGEC